MDTEWVGKGWYCPDDGSDEHTGTTKWIPAPKSAKGAKFFKSYDGFKEFKKLLRAKDKLL
jgi:hypothetical protein